MCAGSLAQEMMNDPQFFHHAERLGEGRQVQRTWDRADYAGADGTFTTGAKNVRLKRENEPLKKRCTSRRMYREVRLDQL